jgi:hypothetical protein
MRPEQSAVISTYTESLVAPARSAFMSDSLQQKPGVKHRLMEELKNYAFISAYLFICFSVILLYEAALAPVGQNALLELGVALGKALVLGKFVLIGAAVESRTQMNTTGLVSRVARRTVLILAVLIALKLLEELIIGVVHDRSIANIIGELTGQPWLHLLAPVLLMLLILIPLITTSEVSRALGRGRLKQLLFDKGASRP